MEIPGDDLASLERDLLADELVKVAQQARSALAQGDRLTPLRQLRLVQAACKRARGEQLALLEVAASFLKALGQAEFGKFELALREFLADAGDQGAEFLAEISERSSALGALSRHSHEVQQGIERLRELGLVRTTSDRIDLHPQWRPFVRNLLEAPVFRHWREVEEARGVIGLNRYGPEFAAQFLSARFGVPDEEAARFLKRSPLPSAGRTKRLLYEAPPRGLRPPIAPDETAAAAPKPSHPSRELNSTPTVQEAAPALGNEAVPQWPGSLASPRALQIN